jgi:inner membrane protease ATP23
LTGAPVRFMVDALRKAGCAVDRRFFTVETCDQQVVGGFRPPDGVRTAAPRAPP